MIPGFVQARLFGSTASGEDVWLYTLRNAAGVEVSISSWGATVVGILTPDRAGRLADVVLGCDSLDGYLGVHPYLGATIGRFGNRIRNGCFTLDGREHRLACNNGRHHLHGGEVGFDHKLWHAHAGDHGVELGYASPDGEEGYPGTLKVIVSFTLNDANELRIGYTATTDQPTIVNLSNHSYFNLAGAGNILGHWLWINGTRFTPTDAGQIPTGELRPVAGTPFDFTTPHPVGARIDAADEQLRLGHGYDHNWVLDGAIGSLRLAARVSEPSSGRVLEVLTTEPGLQFYSGNFLDGAIAGKGGRPCARRSALCLETQHYPDSPNRPEFPTTILRPGEQYRSATVYRFTTQGQA